MKTFQKVASTFAVTLLTSFLVPIQALGFDPGLVTKTITVEKADGTPYGAGATVGLVYENDEGFIEIETPAITGNDGVAILSAPGDRNYLGLAVAPSVSDSVHALEYLESGSNPNNSEIEISRWDESYTVSLREAEFFVEPYIGSSGSTLAPIGTGFSLWEGDLNPQELYLPRTGRVGVALSVEEGFVGLRINANTLGYFGGQVGFQYGDSTLVPEEWGFEYDPTSRTAEIRLHEANISGQLVDGNGDQLSLESGVHGSIRFFIVDEYTPLRMGSSGDGLGQINPDGTFSGWADWIPETVDDGVVSYVPQVFLGGSSELPSFIGSTFSMGFDGTDLIFSSSEDMSSPSLELTVEVPDASEINVRFQSVRKGTVISEPALIELWGMNLPWWGRILATNGAASYVLPDGDYQVFVTPLSGARPQGQFELSVDGSEIELSNCCVFDSDLEDWVSQTIAPFDGGPNSASFYVSGRVNDDIRILMSHPVTGELLGGNQVQAYVGYNTSLNRGTRDGDLTRRVGGGVFAVDFPEEYYTGSPLVIGVEPANENNLDPLLTRREYTVVQDEDTLQYSILDSAGNTLSPTTSSSESDSETYILPLGYANVFGNLIDSRNQIVGTDWRNDRYVFGNVQRFVSQDRWDYIPGGVEVREDGSFGIELENGVYRIIFTPSGYNEVAETTTPAFTISDEIQEWSLSDFVLNDPLLAIEVVEPNGTVPLRDAHVQIRNEERRYYSGTGTGWSARANLSLEPGTYELVAEAPFERRSEFPKRSYLLEITGSPGALTASITRDGIPVESTMSGTLEVFRLELGTPNLRGLVLDPSGEPVFDAQIMPVDPSTGWDMWELSVPTAVDGSWSLDLPEGKYDLYARTPWGSSQFGNSLLLEGIEVDPDGQVLPGSLPVGSTAESLVLSLRNPAFSGTVVDPDNGDPLTNAEVCLFGPSQGICVVTNEQGRWALSEPQGFEGFDGWELMVREYFDARYSQARYRDADEIEDALGIVGGYDSTQTYPNIVLTLPSPNVSIRVMAGENPVANAWVSLDRPGFWTGANSDENGYAKFFLDEPTRSTNVRIDVNNVSSLQGEFTGVQSTLDFNDSDAIGGLFSTTISLAIPNFIFSVMDPDGSDNVPNAWVELFDAQGQRWLQGSGADRLGNGSMFLATESSQISYRLKVNPSGNSSEFARSYFDVVVAVNGEVTVSDADGPITPDSSNRVPLALSTPNVTGRVVQPDSSSTVVRDSFVVPIDSVTDWYLWQLGTNSNRQGEFSMFLEDGSYRLEASVPYHLTGLARSAKCDIEVSGEQLVSVGNCGSLGSGIVLTLREPNLKFRLVKGLESTPVPFANVGVRIGDYSVFAQADRFGTASLFLDEDEMFEAADRALTLGWVRDQDQDSANGIQVPITFWVDPSWGSDDIVRWECETGENEPLCSQVAGIEKVSGQWQTWSASGDIGDVTFKAPNTRVQIFYPSSGAAPEPVGEGAWVNLFRETGSWREWISGSNTNDAGYALFDIPEAIQGSTFSLEISAPWYERSEFPSRTFTGLDLDTTSPDVYYSLTGPSAFELPTKNLQVSVGYDPGSGSTMPAKWSWISVETIQTVSGNVVYAWIGGNQTDESGSAAFYLEPDADTLFKLTVHPGPGVAATRYSCVLGSDGSGFTAPSWIPNGEPTCGSVVEGELSLTLGNGNVRGTVTDSSSSAIVGAIILADDGNGNTVTATTNSTGDYFLDLDSSAHWELRVIYVDSTDSDPFVSRVDDGATPWTEDDVLSLPNPSNPGPNVVDVVLYRESEI